MGMSVARKDRATKLIHCVAKDQCKEDVTGHSDYWFSYGYLKHGCKRHKLNSNKCTTMPRLISKSKDKREPSSKADSYLRTVPVLSAVKTFLDSR